MPVYENPAITPLDGEVFYCERECKSVKVRRMGDVTFTEDMEAGQPFECELGEYCGDCKYARRAK